MRPVEIARQRLVEHRHQRRALAARRHIGGAEIMNHGHVQPAGERQAVADLHRQLGRRSMQHGLPVKADNGDALFADMLIGKKRLDRLGMRAGDEGFRFGEHARPLVAGGQSGARSQRLPQQSLLGLAIGPVAGRPEGAMRSPSVSISATSTPSSEVPLISPIALTAPKSLPLHLFAGPVTPPPQATDKPPAGPDP